MTEISLVQSKSNITCRENDKDFIYQYNLDTK